jgi:hypothetical protein
MAIHTKLTSRDPNAKEPQQAGSSSSKPERSDEEKAQRKERVAAAKDALARSATLKGDHVMSARAALKSYLQRLNEPRQPDDSQFQALVEAPFRQPPKKKNDRRF